MICVFFSMFVTFSARAEEIVSCPEPSRYRDIAASKSIEIDGWRSLDAQTMALASPVEVVDAQKLSVITLLENWDGIQSELDREFNNPLPIDPSADTVVYEIWKPDTVRTYVLCTYDENSKYVIYRLQAAREKCTVTKTGMNCK